MAEWARLNVGQTPNGLQIWCIRHDLNVLHLRTDELVRRLTELAPQCGNPFHRRS
jgi:hypothetical protein